MSKEEHSPDLTLYEGNNVNIGYDQDCGIIMLNIGPMSIMLDETDFKDLCNGCFIGKTTIKELESKK